MVRFTVFPPLPVFRSFATTAWILPYRRRAHPSHDQLSVVGAPSMLECRRIAADDGVNPGGTRSDNMAVIQGRLASPRLSFLPRFTSCGSVAHEGTKTAIKDFSSLIPIHFQRGDRCRTKGYLPN